MFDLQKANMWKRMSAYLFDFILLCTLAVGIAFLLSNILGYDTYTNKLGELQKAYEEKYSISMEISSEDYEKLSDDEKAIYETANREFSQDTEVVRVYNMLIHLALIITTFGILISYLLLELTLPLLFKNGQTLGKKIFSIAVVRVDGVKITAPMLFVRTVLGKFTIETMAPTLLIMMVLFGVMGIVGVAVVLLLLILQIAVISVTKTKSAIHDLISGTVTVDMASQLIFDSVEELIEYKKKLHAENVTSVKY